MSTLFWILGVSLSLSFLCSVLEAVLLSVTRSFVVVLKDRGVAAGVVLERFQRKIDEPIAAILTLNTIAHTVGAALGGAVALRVFGDTWISVFSAVLTLVILLFSEILPKTLGATYWKELALPATQVLRAMVWVMKPVIVPLSLFNRLITPQHSRPSVSRAELEVMAEIGRREGTLDQDEWEVVSNVIRLDEVTVAEVMTPRTDMVAVSVDATVEDAMETMLEEGHLRLPVYDGTLDRIVGILLARDLWRAARGGANTLRAVLRPPQFAPGSKPVEDLIPEMRRRRTKMVIVVDEFGGTAGLATLEDLIEEIIGEIQDEHEADEPDDFQEMAGGAIRIWGGVAVREVNERLEVDLPEGQHDTIGGWMFGELSRVPVPGDVVERSQGSFRVLRMRGRRVEYVEFRPSPGEDRER